MKAFVSGFLMVVGGGCAGACGGGRVNGPQPPVAPSTTTTSASVADLSPDTRKLSGDRCLGPTRCSTQERCEVDCEAGDAFSCLELAKLYRRHMAHEKNAAMQRALDLGREQCRSGNGSACLAAAAVLRRRLVRLGAQTAPGLDCQWAPTALQYSELACEYGCASECYELARGYLCTERDEIIPKVDAEKGRRLLKRACDSGVAEACFDLSHPKVASSECLECYRTCCGCAEGGGGCRH